VEGSGYVKIIKIFVQEVLKNNSLKRHSICLCIHDSKIIKKKNDEKYKPCDIKLDVTLVLHRSRKLLQKEVAKKSLTFLLKSRICFTSTRISNNEAEDALT
jgi:hypothetical protein